MRESTKKKILEQQKNEQIKKAKERESRIKARQEYLEWVEKQKIESKDRRAHQPFDKIYISGKITGLAGYAELFAEGVMECKLRGYTAIMNPAVLSGCENFDHGDYMHICFAMMDVCGSIYLLRNWKDSRGAKMEYAYAVQRGMHILYQDQHAATQQSVKAEDRASSRCFKCVHEFSDKAASPCEECLRLTAMKLDSSATPLFYKRLDWREDEDESEEGGVVI